MAKVAPAEPQRPLDPHDVVFAGFVVLAAGVVFVGFVVFAVFWAIVVKGKPKILFDCRGKEMVWVGTGGGDEYD